MFFNKKNKESAEEKPQKYWYRVFLITYSADNQRFTKLNHCKMIDGIVFFSRFNTETILEML